MPAITLESQRFELESGESVLAGLERHGVEMPSSCRSGVCHTCMLRAVSGTVPPQSQSTLKEAQRRQGLFLSCCCVPEADLEAARCEDALQQIDATVTERDWLSESVVRLRMQCDPLPDYEAGQFMNVVFPDGAIRSYSLASVPGHDAFLEFQIALLKGGKASTWARDAAQAGSSVRLMGPLGSCVYLGGAPERPLLLAGTGTGLAPLYGILRAALADGHQGPIHLFHGSLRREGLYLVDELRALEAAHDNLQYHPGILHGEAEEGIATEALDALIATRLPSLKDYRVYLCGAPEFVQMMQRKAFIAGASLQDIHADAFLPAAQPKD